MTLLDSLARKTLLSRLPSLSGGRLALHTDSGSLRFGQLPAGVDARGREPLDAVITVHHDRFYRQALLGSDIGHFDVVDATEVIEEAWEMVEHGFISRANFREFTFTNAVECYCGMDGDFFKGTIIENDARRELPLARARDFTKP